jgi:heat shock protein HslJ
MTSLVAAGLALATVFQVPNLLEGTWKVEIIDHIPVLPEAPVTVTLRDTRITGDASCNTFQGTMTVDGTTLRVHGLLTTMRACDRARMDQEREFLALLRSATRYEILADGRLRIANEKGKTLTASRQ